MKRNPLCKEFFGQGANDAGLFLSYRIPNDPGHTILPRTLNEIISIHQQPLRKRGSVMRQGCKHIHRIEGRCVCGRRKNKNSESAKNKNAKVKTSDRQEYTSLMEIPNSLKDY